ncbi:DnaB-like helicase C-terminal domain-containing protein [Embleya sp. MST-111070]|uniref:DnaB-like helicase C-terminal domain-containing protein n=1 Tax=Embleya sp. MST-111070 TaxID=3398231 RepID=UPI003F73F20E
MSDDSRTPTGSTTRRWLKPPPADHPTTRQPRLHIHHAVHGRPLRDEANVVLLLHRDDAYDLESSRAGEADIRVAKNRSGPTGIATVAFQAHYARFVDFD